MIIQLTENIPKFVLSTVFFFFSFQALGTLSVPPFTIPTLSFPLLKFFMICNSLHGSILLMYCFCLELYSSILQLSVNVKVLPLFTHLVKYSILPKTSRNTAQILSRNLIPYTCVLILISYVGTQNQYHASALALSLIHI